jgi:hypothetical protein
LGFKRTLSRGLAAQEKYEKFSDQGLQAAQELKEFSDSPRPYKTSTKNNLKPLS